MKKGDNIKIRGTLLTGIVEEVKSEYDFTLSKTSKILFVYAKVEGMKEVQKYVINEVSLLQ